MNESNNNDDDGSDHNYTSNHNDNKTCDGSIITSNIIITKIDNDITNTTNNCSDHDEMRIIIIRIIKVMMMTVVKISQREVQGQDVKQKND